MSVDENEDENEDRAIGGQDEDRFAFILAFSSSGFPRLELILGRRLRRYV